MIRLLFRDSGEIWELADGVRLDKHRVDLAVDNMVWFRKYFRETCKDVSLTAIESEGSIVGFISVCDYFIRYTKCYDADKMVECDRVLLKVDEAERSL